MLHVHRHFLGGQVVRITNVKPFPLKSSHDLSREQRKRAWNATEYPPSGPKVAPNPAARSIVVVRMARKKTASPFFQQRNDRLVDICACLWMAWDDCYGNKHAHFGWKWHWAGCQGHVQPSCNLTPLRASLGADRDETIESGHREQGTKTALRGSSGSTWSVLLCIFLHGEWQWQTKEGWGIG